MNEELFNIFIKNFGIYLYILFLNFKILNKKCNKTNVMLIMLLSIIIAFGYLILQKYLDKLLMIVIMYFLQLIIVKLMVGKDKNNALMISNLISNSIIYIIFVLSMIMELLFINVFNINNKFVNLTLILLIEGIILVGLTNIKRFKHGITFLQNRNNDYFNIIMITISVVVILAYYLSGNYYGNTTKQFIICILVLGCIMFLVIQKTLTLYYKQKLLHQTIEDYKNEISEKDKKIKELSDEKYKISKLNHEFYNRQKALEKKVADYVSNVSVETANELAITEQIADLSKEYSDKLQNIKHPDKLPTTEIEEIDDMFKYMQSECKKNNIEFKLQINGNIHHMINQIIPKDKLVTLIGDHLRDAIIAINSSNNSFKSIIAILGKADEFYEFCVFDTGIEFELETLLALGTKPITTHKDTGGTGYGFMTTFETLRETKGSLVIEEKHKMSENDYTKAVRIIFDGKAQYRISSYRMKEQNKSIL